MSFRGACLSVRRSQGPGFPLPPAGHVIPTVAIPDVTALRRDLPILQPGLRTWRGAFGRLSQGGPDRRDTVMLLYRHHQPGSVMAHLPIHRDRTALVRLAHLVLIENERDFTDPGPGLVPRGSHDTGCLTLAQDWRGRRRSLNEPGFLRGG